MSKYTEQELAKAVAQAREAEKAEWSEIAALREEVIKTQERRIADLEAKLEEATKHRPSREALRKQYEQYFRPGTFNLTKVGELSKLDPVLADEFRRKYLPDIFKAA